MRNNIVYLFVLKIFNIYKNSFVSTHLFGLIITIIIFLGYMLFDRQEVGSDEYLSVLNSISVLSAFFLIGIEKVNYKKILHDASNNKIRGKHKTKKEGYVLVNTYFSFLITQVLLIGIQYLLILFKVSFVFALILNIVYLVEGFLILVGTWQGHIKLEYEKEKTKNTK